MIDSSETLEQPFNLGELVDGQRIGRAAVLFLVLATAALIADGFDIAAMGYMLPELVKTWHVTPGALVPALSAGVFGLLFGAPLFGYVGDRFGRRTAILAALSGVGAFSLMTMAASSPTDLVVLRFITGVGLGGLIPNVIALAAEVAPKRARGTFIIIVNFGVPAGFVVPGWVAAWAVPHYGWQALMLVGGVLPLLVAALTFLFMKESVGFMQQRGASGEEIRGLLAAIRPDVAIPAGARFVGPSSEPVTGSRMFAARLFAGGLAVITPIFWIALAANQFANFFTLSWLPTLLQSSGLSTAEAGISASMYSVGGIVGGLVLVFLIDRLGAIPMVVLFLLGAPLIAAIGMPHLSPIVLVAVIAGAGFCITGNQFGTSAAVGMIYPTAVRSMGAGWAQAFGRVGSLAAQIVGGWLLAQHLTMQEMYVTPAFVLLIGAAAAALFVVLCFRRFGSYRLDDTASPRSLALKGKLSPHAPDSTQSVV